MADIFHAGFQDNVDFYFQELLDVQRNVPLGLLPQPVAGHGASCS
jgi:hypothetical protein